MLRLDAIGDFVLWLDAAQGLRNLYPAEQYEITLLGNQVWIPLAQQVPHFDRVWPLARKRYLLNPVYFLRTLAKVAGQRFDLVLSPAFSREFKLSDVIVKACGAPERIGSRSDHDRISTWQKRIGDRFYTLLVPASAEPLMELERNAEFLRGLGARGFRAALPALPRFMALPEGFAVRDYAVLVPGASSLMKQWPPERFAELARRIQARTGWATIICGDGKEQVLGDRVAVWAGPGSQNWAGRTSLIELCAIIANARLVVANDTSAVHIAAAAATPALCILGGGHFGRFLPYALETPTARPLPVAVSSPMDCYGCSWTRCRYPSLKSTARCVSDIGVDEVWVAASALLDKATVDGA